MRNYKTLLFMRLLDFEKANWFHEMEILIPGYGVATCNRTDSYEMRTLATGVTVLPDDPDQLQGFYAAFCDEVFLDETLDNRKSERYSTAACDYYCS